MIYSASGKLISKNPRFIVLETSGLGFKIFISPKNFKKLPKTGSKIRIFCFTNIRQNAVELYGFVDEKELEIFEFLNSINSVGPKTALKILNADIEKILTIAKNNRADLLVKTAQIGKKTAQRIILELQGKIKALKNKNLKLAEDDAEIESALKNLGYKTSEIQETIERIPLKISRLEERLKAALKILAK